MLEAIAEGSQHWSSIEASGHTRHVGECKWAIRDSNRTIIELL